MNCLFISGRKISNEDKKGLDMSNLHEFGTIINIIGGILLAYGYLPHIYSLYKNKTPGGNSIQYWIVMSFGVGCITFNMFVHQMPLVQLITQAVNVALAIISTLVLIYYKVKEDKNLKESKI